jgi:NTE family protein
MRALVLGGGGSKGPYHLGAITSLLSQGYRFDLFAGVSVGALMAAYLAQFDDRDVLIGHRALVDIMMRLNTTDVWRNWKFWRRVAGLWKTSIYNSSGLHALIEKSVDPKKIRESGKKLRIGAVDLYSRGYEVFDETYVPLNKAIAASASLPFAFSPVSMGGSLWVDGGVRAMTPLASAIEAGATDIVAITLQPKEASLKFKDKPNALDIGLHSIDLMSDEIVTKDIKIAQLYTKIRGLELQLAGACGHALDHTTNKRAVKVLHIRPQFALNEDSAKFMPAEAVRLYQQGQEDAQHAVFLATP